MVSADINHFGPAFAEANGLKLCYETFGDRADPPIVLVMGLGAQMILWDEDFCRELAARGRYVIRFDNRDIGQSTRFDDDAPRTMLGVLLAGVARWTAPARYSLRDMAADTVGLMDALGLESAHVAGVSMGGAIAQEIAIHFRARIRTLTSIMSSTGDATRLPPPTFAALGVLLARPPQTREGYVNNFVRTWRVLTGDVFPFDEPQTRAQAERAFARGPNPAGVARQMAAINATGNRKWALRALTIPTLVIHGTNDPLMRFKAAGDLVASIPGAQLLAIEGMGHSLPRGAWPRILDAIERITSLENTNR